MLTKRCPFRILVDSAEGHPWTFENIQKDPRTVWEVDTQYACLGRNPNGLGDYAIGGIPHLAAIERKSPEDCVSTILGFSSGRRARFEQELANLSQLSSVVIVECDIETLLWKASIWSGQPAQVCAKQVNSSIIALMQDYRVPWLFCHGRRHAEICAFRWLYRFWKNRN